MEVIGFLVGLVLLGLVLYCLYVVGAIVLIVIGLWPAIIAVLIGAWIWVSGHDNWGALILLAGIAAEYFWLDRITRPQAGASENDYRRRTVKELLEEISEKLNWR